ncbi:hypothetical protein [Campylobacter curvus]|uniref:hypothetical protein n=1 Tax=Campylobacter curvus TaxID=200 RepID=UPI001470581E|nr:hypothetical protein [Campylobacter curvus]
MSKLKFHSADLCFTPKPAQKPACKNCNDFKNSNPHANFGIKTAKFLYLKAKKLSKSP